MKQHTAFRKLFLVGILFFVVVACSTTGDSESVKDSPKQNQHESEFDVGIKYPHSEVSISKEFHGVWEDSLTAVDTNTKEFISINDDDSVTYYYLASEKCSNIALGHLSGNLLFELDVKTNVSIDPVSIELEAYSEPSTYKILAIDDENVLSLSKVYLTTGMSFSELSSTAAVFRTYLFAKLPSACQELPLPKFLKTKGTPNKELVGRWKKLNVENADSAYLKVKDNGHVFAYTVEEFNCTAAFVGVVDSEDFYVFPMLDAPTSNVFEIDEDDFLMIDSSITEDTLTIEGTFSLHGRYRSFIIPTAACLPFGY